MNNGRLFTSGATVLNLEQTWVIYKWCARGEATLAGFDANAGQTMKVFFQNEFLLAERDGQAVATTPDLIAMLDLDTGEPITTEVLRYGFRVAVIGVPCDSQWRTPQGLELVGPAYFKYDTKYVPLEPS